MIESLAGIAVGLLAAIGFKIPAGEFWSGATGALLALALSDELIAALSDTGRKIAAGAGVKFALVVFAAAMESVVSVPVAQFLMIAFMFSIYKRLDEKFNMGAGVKQ